MNRILACLLLLGFTAQEPPPVAKSEPMTPADEQKVFHLPPGFQIQLVASEPDINKPMNLAFDDRGRLFVTSSVEYPFPAKEGIPARDAVKMLEDFGPDGRARKISTFVPGLNIPIGVVPTADGVICHSIPKIWRCTEGKREPLYGDVGSRDTHGMVNAFTPWVDGWIYACHGFANHSELKSVSSGSGIVMDSGNTFRMKADGSKVEYYSHGQVNPFGLSFDPLGNLFSADCHSKPVYQLLRGGWYETFGGQHDGLGHAPLMMTHLHGSTAIGGIVYYAASQFPAAYRDTVLVGNPVTGRINHDRFEKHGSTLKAVEQPDFLKCDDPWFRPVDLELAPDGSIYVADFYNRIIGHYEVPLTHPGRDRERGRIWRIVYTGEKTKPMPDLFKATADELAALLKDDNLQVRVRATNQLVERIGKASVEPARKAGGAHALWVLERLGSLDEAGVRAAATDPDRTLRVHVLKVLAERKAWTFEAPLVRERLKDEDAFVRRAAAEALALHPDRENVKPLIDLWSATPADDTHLVHMVRMALRDQLAGVGYAVAAGLDKESARRIANVSPGVRNEESAAYVLAWMKGEPPDAGLLRYVTRYVKADALASVFEYAKTLESRPGREQLPLIRSVQQACQERGAKLPEAFSAWARSAVGTALAGEDKAAVADAIKLCRELQIREAYGDLEKLALTGKNTDLRQAAFDALPLLDPVRGGAALVRIAGSAEESMTIRQRAVGALAARNSPEARAELLKLLQAAPQPLAVQIAIGLAGTREGVDSLLGAIGEGKASPRLLVDKAVEGRLRATNVKELIDRRDKIVKDLPPEDERVTQLLKARQKGYAAAKPNAARGAEVFAKSCAGCHKLDGKGQKVGPELDAVYTRGAERLLEDILDPNRNVDQAFRASLIKTTDGRVISGLVVREEGEVLVIQEAVDKETRLSKKDIEQRVLSQLSPMPTNVSEPLSEPDFYDLLAYLLQPRGQK